jgi:hypothetical protein
MISHVGHQAVSPSLWYLDRFSEEGMVVLLVQYLNMKRNLPSLSRSLTSN